MLSKTRTTIITLVAAFSFAGASLAPTSALAEDPTAWKYGPGVAQPLPAHPYDLSLTYSTHPTKPSLVYGFQTFFPGFVAGAELQWASGSHRQWEFQRQPGHPATKAITGTERVALVSHFHLGEYLIREHQDWGISLGFSPTPSYEWQVADGQPSLYVGGVELYNTNEQAYLLLDFENYGPGEVNLRWLHAPFSLPNGYQAPPESGQARKGSPEALPEPPKNKPESGSPEPPKNAPEGGSTPPAKERPTTGTPPAAQ